MHFEAHSYGCLMLKLPKAMARKVMALGAAIPDELIHDDEEGELGREDDPHVTLKYGLHTGDAEEVREKLASRWPVSARLGKVTAFDNPDYVVLKVDVTGASLRALNAYVCREFEFTDKFPDYHPHATIAYLKKNDDDPDFWKEYVGDLGGDEFEVDEVEWSPADGDKVMIPLGGERPAARAARIAFRVANSVLAIGLEHPGRTVQEHGEFNEALREGLARAYGVPVHQRFGEMRVMPNGKHDGPHAVVLSTMTGEGRSLLVEVFRGPVGRYPPLPDYKAKAVFDDDKQPRDVLRWLRQQLRRGFAKVASDAL